MKVSDFKIQYFKREVILLWFCMLPFESDNLLPLFILCKEGFILDFYFSFSYIFMVLQVDSRKRKRKKDYWEERFFLSVSFQ